MLSISSFELPGYQLKLEKLLVLCRHLLEFAQQLEFPENKVLTYKVIYIAYLKSMRVLYTVSSGQKIQFAILRCTSLLMTFTVRFRLVSISYSLLHKFDWWTVIYIIPLRAKRVRRFQIKWPYIYGRAWELKIVICKRKIM